MVAACWLNLQNSVGTGISVITKSRRFQIPDPLSNYGFPSTSGHHSGWVIRRLICFSCSNLSQAKSAWSRVPVLANLVPSRRALVTTDLVRTLGDERDGERWGVLLLTLQPLPFFFFLRKIVELNGRWMKYEYGTLVKWYWRENRLAGRQTRPSAILFNTNSTKNCPPNPGFCGEKSAPSPFRPWNGYAI
jgi:hypothetical protein